MNDDNARTTYYTPSELAKMWRISVDRIMTLIERGELRAFDLSATSRRRLYRISP